MLFRRRRVLCTNCGFLCWHVQHVSGEGPYRFAELRQHARDDFQAGSFGGTEEEYETQEYFNICCLRGQWTWAPNIKARPYYADADSVSQPRKCMYYIGYEPGFGPEEHKELKRLAETNRAIRKASILAAIIGALIGAASAIIVQLISR